MIGHERDGVCGFGGIKEDGWAIVARRGSFENFCGSVGILHDFLQIPGAMGIVRIGGDVAEDALGTESRGETIDEFAG